MEGRITLRYALAQMENWPQDEAGVPVVDTGWFNSALYPVILDTRAALYTKLHNESPEQENVYMTQTLGCIELKEAPLHTCPCAPPPKCTWFEADIPVHVGKLITVTGIGMQLHDLTHYTFVEWTNMKYVLKARYEAERTRGYYTEKNGKLYLITMKHERLLSIRGVFYDPIEAQRSYGCDKKGSCAPFMDFEIFVAPEHLQIVMAASLEVVTGMRKVAKFDFKNDAIPK